MWLVTSRRTPVHSTFCIFLVLQIETSVAQTGESIVRDFARPSTVDDAVGAGQMPMRANRALVEVRHTLENNYSHQYEIHAKIK